MCGITGIISVGGIEKEYLCNMSNSLQHRGPDGYGYMLYSKDSGIKLSINKGISANRKGNDTVGFAHRRLSILDLSLINSQPMMDESGIYCVVYNGEIYNYVELKRELEGLDYSFKTTGDTEVLLRAYEAWGPSCLDKFNGMWAFALLDTRKQCVIFSRDRFGIKPLYYTILNNSIYFASEIKALLTIPSIDRKPNMKILAHYLLTGLVNETEETFFKGIYEFPAAHWAAVPLTSNSMRINPRPYWSLPTTVCHDTEDSAIKQFRELFLDAIKLHARSDVPVGTCLSGGLDSSSIVCCSEMLRRKNLIPMYSHSAFGYCSSDEWSEKKYMDIIKKATSANVHYVTISQEDFKKNIPQIVVQQDEPFGSASIIAQWFVFRRAKEEGVTVMLDGQGADEILGGYQYYFSTIALNLLFNKNILEYLALRFRYKREIGKFPLNYRLLSIATLATLMPSQMLKLSRPFIRFIRRRAERIIHTDQKIAPYTDDLMMQHSTELSVYERRRTLNEELQIQLKSTSLPGLLRFEDRNSMSHSIEARVPFLDYRLVEFLFRLPDNFKINKVTTKYILREAMKGILPEPIRARKDKIGFMAAPRLTLSYVRNHYNDLIENQTDLEEQIFEPRGVKNLIENDASSNSLEFQLWRILNAKLWIRHHWG